MDADVADRRGEMARQIEQGLGLAPPVGAARDALAERQDAHQLSVRGERDGDDGLEHRHLPGDLARGGVGRPPERLLDLDEPSLRHQPERQAAVGGEADRLDDVRREPARRAHPILPVLVLGEEDRAPARARQLGDGVEEEIEHAREIEARGERLGELLGDLVQLPRGAFVGQVGLVHAGGRVRASDEPRVAPSPPGAGGASPRPGAARRAGAGVVKGCRTAKSALSAAVSSSGERPSAGRMHTMTTLGRSCRAFVMKPSRSRVGRSDLLEDQVYLGEPERAERLLVGGNREDRAVLQRPGSRPSSASSSETSRTVLTQALSRASRPARGTRP